MTSTTPLPQPLSGHGIQSMSKQLHELWDSVDPHLSADVYGQGETIARFEDKVARLLHKEASVFMPSGTMAQQIALRIYADANDDRNVAMHPTCHLYEHEQHGYKHLHDLNAVLVGTHGRTLNLSDLKAASNQFSSFILELPQRHNGGALPTWDELVEMTQWCKGEGINLHLDGARLWETAAYYKNSIADTASLFDSVYVSFYKGIGAMGGAMLLGSTQFIDEARIWQRRHGGNLITLYPYVISSDLGLDRRLPRMPEYFKKTLEVANIANSCKNIRVIPETPHTNMLHLGFAGTAHAVDAANEKSWRECGTKIMGKVWLRPFDPQPVSEIYIGDAALGLSADQIREGFQTLDRHLTPS